MHEYNNRNRNKKTRRAAIYKVSKECKYDRGYSPLKEEVDEMWLGINCDNPGEKPSPTDNCKYPNYNPPYSTYQGMDPEDLDDIKLECAYTKYNWTDSDKTKNKKRLENIRKKVMLSTIQSVCKQNKQFCSKIAFDGTNKEPDPRCLVKNTCGVPLPGLSEFVDDIKDFYKVIMELFDFSNLKMNIDTDKVTDENKERSKVLSKAMKALKEKYKRLTRPPPPPLPGCDKKKNTLDKDVGLYEVEYAGKKECFTPEEIQIIEEYINHREEQVKIDPSMMKRLKRMGRSAKKTIHKTAKRIKKHGNNTIASGEKSKLYKLGSSIKKGIKSGSIKKSIKEAPGKLKQGVSNKYKGFTASAKNKYGDFKEGAKKFKNSAKNKYRDFKEGASNKYTGFKQGASNKYTGFKEGIKNNVLKTSPTPTSPNPAKSSPKPNPKSGQGAPSSGTPATKLKPAQVPSKQAPPPPLPTQLKPTQTQPTIIAPSGSSIGATTHRSTTTTATPIPTKPVAPPSGESIGKSPSIPSIGALVSPIVKPKQKSQKQVSKATKAASKPRKVTQLTKQLPSSGTTTVKLPQCTHEDLKEEKNKCWNATHPIGNNDTCEECPFKCCIKQILKDGIKDDFTEEDLKKCKKINLDKYKCKLTPEFLKEYKNSRIKNLKKHFYYRGDIKKNNGVTTTSSSSNEMPENNINKIKIINGVTTTSSSSNEMPEKNINKIKIINGVTTTSSSSNILPEKLLKNITNIYTSNLVTDSNA